MEAEVDHQASEPDEVLLEFAQDLATGTKKMVLERDSSAGWDRPEEEMEQFCQLVLEGTWAVLLTSTVAADVDNERQGRKELYAQKLAQVAAKVSGKEVSYLQGWSDVVSVLTFYETTIPPTTTDILEVLFS